MSGLEIRELEAFLAVADELHFGRAGELLYVSQSRVSQLLQALERRVGARLVERTSRRVRLTPLGERFAAELRPAYDALRGTVDVVSAEARGVRGLLRIGFQGSVNDPLADAVTLFHRRHPESATEITEVPFSDPFGPLYRGEVDVAVVLLPVREPELVLGVVFSEQPQSLLVSSRHPFAARESLSAEELAGCPLIRFRPPAPEYWLRAQAPGRTPGGLPVPTGDAVSTLQEGLALVAADRGAMVMCRDTARTLARRTVTPVPVVGLGTSRLGLVWHRAHETARVRAFAEAVRAVERPVRAAGRPAAGGSDEVPGLLR